MILEKDYLLVTSLSSLIIIKMISDFFYVKDVKKDELLDFVRDVNQLLNKYDLHYPIPC